MESTKKLDVAKGMAGFRQLAIAALALGDLHKATDEHLAYQLGTEC